MDLELKKLCELLDFGAECMDEANIPSLRRLRGAKRHLFMLTVIVHNYCESICVLSKQARTHSAAALLRPVCECLIKARYLYCNPRLHLWELRLEAFVEKRKQLNEMKGLLVSGRLAEGVSTQLTVDEVQSSLDRVHSSIEYCKRFFHERGGKVNEGKVSLIGTLEKAKYVDIYNSNKGFKSGSLEYLYHLVYRTLSSDVHVDGRNFSDFLSWCEEGCEVLLSGDVTRVPDIARLAYWLYHQLMRQFFLVFRIPCVRRMSYLLADK